MYITHYHFQMEESINSIHYAKSLKVLILTLMCYTKVTSSAVPKEHFCCCSETHCIGYQRNTQMKA